MKEFIYNDCSVCTNPNVIERSAGGYDSFEIRTAEYQGKWHVSTSFFYNLGGMSSGVSFKTTPFETETEAILHGVSILRQRLTSHKAAGTKLFSMLNEIIPDSLQLTLF